MSEGVDMLRLLCEGEQWTTTASAVTRGDVRVSEWVTALRDGYAP